MAEKLKPLTSTYLFKFYDKSLNLQEKMLKLVTESDEVSVADLPKEFSEIERIYHFASKLDILSDVNSRKVIPIYCQKDFVVPSTIPSFLFNKGGRIYAFTNLSNVATKSRDDVYRIDTKALFVLLQSGTILARCFTKYNKLRVNSAFLKQGTIIYSQLVTKTLNKMFSLNTLPDKLEITHFLAGLFFLVNVVGLDYDSPNVAKYAVSACKNPNAIPINYVLNRYTADDFKDINTFITALSKNESIYETLNTRNFVDNFIQMYSPNMLLSLEYLPIFLHNIFAVIVGAYVNNQNIIESTCGKEIDKLYKEFFML